MSGSIGRRCGCSNLFRVIIANDKATAVIGTEEGAVGALLICRCIVYRWFAVLGCVSAVALAWSAILVSFCRFCSSGLFGGWVLVLVLVVDLVLSRWY